MTLRIPEKKGYIYKQKWNKRVGLGLSYGV